VTADGTAAAPELARSTSGGRLVRAAPWALVALALAVRLVALDLRPPHSDEGVNGWFAERVLVTGHYRYDPENYHGPLHYYLLALSRLAFGRNLWSLRLPTVLIGVAAVWLAARCADALGRRTAWLMALLLAVSPAMVLYARWAIHETELLFFSLLALRGLCRWWVRPGRPALWMAGMGVTGAVASKEVWVLHAAVLAAAAALWWLLERREGERLAVPLPRGRDLLPVAGCGLAALALLYSGFGLDPDGLRRFFAPYLIWTERAIQGAGHDKPWYYWLQLLARYEQPALLGLLAVPAALLRRAAHPIVRLVALYGLGVLAAYSAVPYKTPWCVLQVLWPLHLVAAWAIASLAPRLPRAAPAVAALLALASLGLAARVCFLRYDDAAEPYVYVQTYRDGLAPVELLRRAAAAEPALRGEPVHVVMRLSWPIPWLLADFPRAGYWRDDQLPPGDALALFVDDQHRPKVEPLLRGSYLVLPFEASPVHAPARAYFDAARLGRWVPAGAERFVGAAAGGAGAAAAPVAAPPASAPPTR
jgi:uncharacterized protein (TIGR03663 family)